MLGKKWLFQVTYCTNAAENVLVQVSPGVILKDVEKISSYE